MKLKSKLVVGAKFPEITLPMLETRIWAAHPNYTPGPNSIWIIQPGPGYVADPDWMQTCGAAGCTPGAKVFAIARDEFAGTGTQVFFVSSKSIEELQKAIVFKNYAFKFLSDVNLQLKELFDLPTFHYKGKEYYYRQAFVVREGVIDRIFTTNNDVKDQDSIAESIRHSEEVYKYAKELFLSQKDAISNPMEPKRKKLSDDYEPHSFKM